MWNTFKAEFHALWKSRVRFASWILLLFMPLIYGMLFLSSFWSPFKNTDKLPIAVVDLDKSVNSKDLVSTLTNNGHDLIFNGGTSEYKIHVTEASDIYTNKDQVESDVNSGKYSAAFVIPQGYGKIVSDIRGQLLANGKTPDLASVINALRTATTDHGLIDFYNSFKVSYVAGEMTNMGSTIYKLITDLVFPDIDSFKNIIHSIGSSIDGIIGGIVKPIISKGTKAAGAAMSQLGSAPYNPTAIYAGAAIGIDTMRKSEDYIRTASVAFPEIKTAFEKAQLALDKLLKLSEPTAYNANKDANQAAIDSIVPALKTELSGLVTKINSLTDAQISNIVTRLKARVLNDLALGNILVNHKTYGKQEGISGKHDILNTYGYGLSPYFLSIVLWAGALLMIFLFPNKRYIKTEGTMKNLAGKTAVWILTGWIQVLLLFAIISIPGIFGTLTYHIDGHAVVVKQCINIGAGQWKLILFALFISTMFMLIVRGIVYTLRVADIGLFLCVILLILQLVSSGGTFPVSMQPSFFKFLHKILPFTYTVEAFREMYWDTDALVVLKDFGILMIIPAIFTTTSIASGLIWDHKTKYVINGKTYYRSMDKNVGSL